MMKKLLAAIIVLAGPALVLAGLWIINRGLVFLAAGGCLWWIVQRGVAAARTREIDRALKGIARVSRLDRNSC